MTDIADRYDRLAADFAATIDAVPADRWASPSPCEEWTARDVVAHVVETHGMFEGMVGRDLGDDPRRGRRSRGRLRRRPRRRARAPVRPRRRGRHLREPDAGHDDVRRDDRPLHLGRPGRPPVGSRHRRRARVALPPDEVVRIREHLAGMGDAMRGPGAFGPEVEPPDDADDQDAPARLPGSSRLTPSQVRPAAGQGRGAGDSWRPGPAGRRPAGAPAPRPRACPAPRSTRSAAGRRRAAAGQSQSSSMRPSCGWCTVLRCCAARRSDPPPTAGRTAGCRPAARRRAGQPGIVGIAGGHVAQRGDGLDRRGLLLAGIGSPPARRRPRNRCQATFRCPAGHAEKSPSRRGRQVVPGEDVALGVEQHGRQVGDAIEQAQRAGPGRRHDVARAVGGAEPPTWNRWSRSSSVSRSARASAVEHLVGGRRARGPARGARGSRPRCPPAAPPPRAAGRGRGGGCPRAARRRLARAGPGTT